MTARIETVAVVGGEIVGWSVAAALKRRLPYLSVTVVPSSSAIEDLANRIVSTLPSIAGFHEDIGLTEADTVARAASGFRLGTRLSGWVEGRDPYIHAYGAHGQQVDSTPFHQLWLSAMERKAEVQPFHRFSLQAALGESGRVANPGSVAANELQYGLQIDRDLYRSMITAFAEHLGVGSSKAAFASARIGPDGFIDDILLDDGSEVGADLFIDCTGPSAKLRSLLSEDFEDWSRWLPCDRVLIGDAPATSELPAIDEVEAVRAGWTWRASSPRTSSVGIAFSSAYLDPDAAAAQLAPTGAAFGEPIDVRQGRRSDPWLRNCVAVGAAAATLEPLEWTNLHLVHSAVDRIIAMMPGLDCAPIELSEYNRQCTVEAERVRDFICLHYIASKRSDPFWEAAREMEPPATLAHSLALFGERGRLPFYEEETFSRDSWLAVLFGQGLFPRRVDPLADLVPAAAADNAMSRLLEMIATAVARLPSHEAYLRNFYQQAVR